MTDEWPLAQVTSCLSTCKKLAMPDRGHADWPVHILAYACKTKTCHTWTHTSSDREVATPVDNSIDHTVRALHSHPGPWEETKKVQIYTTSKETGRRRRRRRRRKRRRRRRRRKWQLENCNKFKLIKIFVEKINVKKIFWICTIWQQ